MPKASLRTWRREAGYMSPFEGVAEKPVANSVVKKPNAMQTMPWRVSVLGQLVNNVLDCSLFDKTLSVKSIVKFMKIVPFISIALLASSIACADNQSQNNTVYATSMPYHGTRMILEFNNSDVSKTPVCSFNDKTFSLTQADAISAALRWANENFDKSKNWRVDQVSLHFVSVGFDDKRCIYVVQLMPKNEMESLPIGVLLNGKIQPPVPEKK